MRIPDPARCVSQSIMPLYSKRREKKREKHITLVSRFIVSGKCELFNCVLHFWVIMIDIYVVLNRSHFNNALSSEWLVLSNLSPNLVCCLGQAPAVERLQCHETAGRCSNQTSVLQICISVQTANEDCNCLSIIDLLQVSDLQCQNYSFHLHNTDQRQSAISLTLCSIFCMVVLLRCIPIPAFPGWFQWFPTVLKSPAAWPSFCRFSLR